MIRRTYNFLAFGRSLATNRQGSRDGPLASIGRGMLFGSAVDPGGEAVPPKFPKTLDFDLAQVCVFVPEEYLGGGENALEFVERGLRHFEFQTVVSRCQKLGLSSPIR